ncbi:MAG TPA: metallophosphoesterase, partial [Candidatus Limnocylindria bacterium]|nr:metallophosphoesterase [Candidatus Limnocylindria bacterium]
DMVLHMGDITYPTFVDGLADTKFLSVYRPLMRQIPFFFAWGNHDFDTSPDAFLHTIRQPISDVPLEQHQLERTLPQYYGSFDAGEVHFAILFQPFVYQYLMRTNGAQYQWLDRDLAQTRKPWKVLIAHQPFASSGLHGRDDTNFDGQRDQTQVDEMIMTLVRKHGVQLFLGGHDHDYERFLPTNGLYSVTTGGGGSVLYPLGSREAGSATFQSRYHFVRLHIDTDEIQARTIGLGGEVFDRFAIRRTAPKAGEHQAAWYTPPMAMGRADDGDGNIKHQHHDFGLAEPVVAKGGEFSNLGTLQVALDAKNLYIGLSGVMLPAGADICLFLGMAGTPGVKGLAGLGNGRLDPNGEGADALDLAENLDFSGFEPTVAAIVGDEMADATIPSFRRAGSVMALGQGVFTLGKSFKPVHDARLQQYNQSPQELPDPAEQNADFIEIALPRESLPGLKDGAVLQIAGVAGAATDTARSIRFFDTGFLGESLSGYGMAKTTITPIKIRLPEAPKP